MAWREIGRKSIRASVPRILTSKALRHTDLSSSLLSPTVGRIRGYASNSSLLGVETSTFLKNRFLIRQIHASTQLLYKGKDDDIVGLQKQKKGKFKKKPAKTSPPVDAPYVPPNLQKNGKTCSDKTVEIFEGITTLELAKRCGQSVASLQNILVNVGEKVGSEFDPLGIDIAELIAMEIGVNVKRLYSYEGSIVLPRAPVVTVMGHVDHGKTSLLDALRQTSVAAKEAGGITQHLGAFVVGMPSGASITFLDTPGHAAFSAMRARGAAVTDIVVLVVAADDGVMPQTLEAMTHARLADVPIVVAINKCDKPASDPERIKVQLASHGLPLEEMGGDVQVVEVSAVTKQGLDKLEEALLLQAELMELKARVDGTAQAYVVEARLDHGRGPLVTALVKAGTIACGQHVAVGSEWGKIRAIRDMSGKLTDRATPAMPVEIEGLKGLPMAGDDITVVDCEERARMLSAGRKKKMEQDRLRKIYEERLSVEEKKKRKEEEKKKKEEDKIKRKEERMKKKWEENGPDSEETDEEEEEDDDEEEEVQRVEMPIIVKGDVQGTVQAVTDSLKSLNSPQVFVNIIHVGVGAICQSDLDLAQATGACIVGFNVRTPPSSISMAAAKAHIKIKVHKVIYHLLEDMGNFIVEKAPGIYETEVAGEAQVLNIFELKGRSKSKGADVKIAGCRVMDGHVSRSCTMRLLRSGEVMFEGCCVSLKRETQDVDTVQKGNECGLVLGNCFDYQIGDVIQCLHQVNKKPKFISSKSGAVRIEC